MPVTGIIWIEILALYQTIPIITNGLYSNIDEDGTTYYYRGDIDNNNLVFGAYDEDYYVYRSEMTIFKQKKVV